MEIRISYSQTQLEKAVNFISRHNEVFKGKKTEIRETILEYMEKMAKDPNMTFIGTMGFTLIGDREFEDMDNDDNLIRIEISVDPALGDDDQFADGDYQEYTINAPAQEVWNNTN